jgi:ion channel-forming bestrophin family protein
MHIGDHYKLAESLYWTRRDLLIISLISTVPALLHQTFGWAWLAIPWVPVSMVGTATAFVVGFKNTQTYNRLWEARQIWGSIINSSRAWGIMVRDFVKADPLTHRQLIYRHCAWLAALRFQLRKPQPWETQQKFHNQGFHRQVAIAEWSGTLDDALTGYLAEDERNYVLTKKNRATQLIALQSKHLAELRQNGQIEPLEYVEMEKRLADLYDQQGRCERIKNFPYPRQFASTALYFVWIFVVMLPFGMLNEFREMGDNFVWLTVPFSVLVSWVFVFMDRIGEATENPFEGGPNDVPITALSRTIEIDLRDMLDESNLPVPLVAINDILL